MAKQPSRGINLRTLPDLIQSEAKRSNPSGPDFEPAFLPTYSPDFNPIERLWLRLKADYFTDFIARTPEQLTERSLSALKVFIDDPETVAASQCATGE